MDASFGAYLRQERENRELSLDDLGKKTKIQKRLLVALEADQLDQLPSLAIVRGFIRSYAEAVSLDPGQAILKFEEFQKKLHPEKNRPKTGPDKHLKVWNFLIPAAVVLVIAGVAVATVLGKKSQKPMPDPTPPPVAPKPIPPTQPLPQNPEPAEPPEIKFISPPFLITIKANEICWLLATIDEKTGREATLYPGNLFEVRAEKRLSILLGNAGGVEMTVNQAVLKPVGAHWKTARILIPDDIAKYLPEGWALKPDDKPEAEPKPEGEQTPAPETKPATGANKPLETKPATGPQGTVLESQTAAPGEKSRPMDKKQPSIPPPKPGAGATVDNKPKPEAIEKKPEPVQPAKPSPGDTAPKKPKVQIIEIKPRPDNVVPSPKPPSKPGNP